MNIYLLEQKENDDYDTYDSCVVLAETEDEARMLHPDKSIYHTKPWEGTAFTWASKPEYVKVTLIGVASIERDDPFICKSFNAG